VESAADADLAQLSRSPSPRVANAAAMLLLIGVAALQWHAGSVVFGSSPQGDAAKHYASGVMVFDYLRHGLPANPIRFARDFEVRYPLVAIGQWPPMYYALQAAFYFLAGPSIRSAQILSVLFAALLAILLFRSIRAHAGTRLALVAAGLFLATPQVQVAAWHIMSDLLTGLFVYLAVVAFAVLLDELRNWRAAAGFVAWAIAAILTKGSAWAFGPFFLLAPLFAHRGRIFLNRWFVCAALAVPLVGSMFYLFAARRGIGYPLQLTRHPSVPVGESLSALHHTFTFAPLSLLVLGIFGALLALDARWRRKNQSHAVTLSLVAAAWVCSQFVFLWVAPMTLEPRVLQPSLAPLALLAADALVWLQNALRARPVLAAIAPAALGAIVLVNCIASPVYRVDGFRQAADDMPYPADGALILVATAPWHGDQEIIAERLSHTAAHRDVILRDDHIVGNVSPAGDDLSPIQSPEAMRLYLLTMPVRFIVLDSPPHATPYLDLVESAVSGDPQDFPVIATVPIVVRPTEASLGELRIFENPAGGDHHPSVVRMRVGAWGGGGILEYHWK
jgi:Dolichyl-phosphate-mannose-protein mannosyltransferase